MRSDKWKQHAKCAKDGVDPDFFYPEAPSGRTKEGTIENREAEVAKYCHGMDGSRPCPVRLECLEYALVTRQDNGVWGGTTEKERIHIRKQRRKTA